MSDLVEFLRARLDDKERQARFRLEDTDSQAGAFELDADDALAEVEANRRIVDLLAEDAGAASGEVAQHEIGDELGRWMRATAILRLLASVYVGHPDYRPEWSLS